MTTTLMQSYGDTSPLTAEAILQPVEPVTPETEIREIFERISKSNEWRSIPVVRNGHPVGLINRHHLSNAVAQPYQREILGKKPCTCIMNPEPFLLEKSIPLQALGGLLKDLCGRRFDDGFIIADNGRYMGVGTWQDLLRSMSHALTTTARYENPLTLLPGYVPINQHIDLLLKSGKSFAVCECGLDNFTAFNQVCGYSRGDALIRFTASILSEACEPTRDVIGHLGGDKFTLVLQSLDWEGRCDRALDDFARSSATLFDRDHRSIGGYLTTDRQGRIVHRPLPTLSIGAIWVIPGTFSSHHEVKDAAMDAKNRAREKAGNVMFTERRHLNPHAANGADLEGVEPYFA